MALKERSIGVDFKIKATVKDASTGNAYDIDNDLSGVAIWLYQDDKIVASYSRDEVSGYNNDDFYVTDSSNGIVTINVQQKISRKLSPGVVEAEVGVQETDAEFENNTFTSKLRKEVVKMTDSRSNPGTL